jgi:hypothetical protein
MTSGRSISEHCDQSLETLERQLHRVRAVAQDTHPVESSQIGRCLGDIDRIAIALELICLQIEERKRAMRGRR